MEVLGRAPDVVAAGHDVLARYDEAHRRYHDRRHLTEVLQAVGTLTAGAGAPAPVTLAAFWHDAVYDPAAPDNEQRSAALAGDTLHRLGVEPAVAAEVARLVLLTRAHAPCVADRHGALLCDADLAVLGADPDRYRTYAEDVRAEYAHLDDESFRRGRAQVLRSLVDRPRLFTTEQGHHRWDVPARRNLRDELARLGAAPPP